MIVHPIICEADFRTEMCFQISFIPKIHKATKCTTRVPTLETDGLHNMSLLEAWEGMTKLSNGIIPNNTKQGIEIFTASDSTRMM